MTSSPAQAPLLVPLDEHCTTRRAFQGFLHDIRRKKARTTNPIATQITGKKQLFFVWKSKLKVIAPDAAGYRANDDLLLRNNSAIARWNVCPARLI
jgi:hypothetical protein